MGHQLLREPSLRLALETPSRGPQRLSSLAKSSSHFPFLRGQMPRARHPLGLNAGCCQEAGTLVDQVAISPSDASWSVMPFGRYSSWPTESHQRVTDRTRRVACGYCPGCALPVFLHASNFSSDLAPRHRSHSCLSFRCWELQEYDPAGSFREIHSE